MKLSKKASTEFKIGKAKKLNDDNRNLGQREPN